MARAYIVLARNDLPENLLQVLDLNPHEQEPTIYDGQRVRPYQTHFSRDAAVNTAVATQAGAGGGASLDTTAVAYGLPAYLIDHVEDAVTAAAITAAVANATRTAIFARVAAGQALDAAGIAAALTANGVANAGAGTTLTAGNSTGVLEEVIRIVAGEVYRLPALSQVTDNAGLFDPTLSGDFVVRPNVETPDSVRTTLGVARALRGRRYTDPVSHLRPGEPRTAPVQTGRQDVLFRDVPALVDTGHLNLSATTGMLADLKAATYAFTNPSFTYNGGATPATTIAGVNIGTNHQGRAVVVYSAAGAVL